MEKKRNEIILFEDQGIKLEVNLKDETGCCKICNNH